jgi:hypothetical protein
VIANFPNTRWSEEAEKVLGIKRDEKDTKD